MGGTSRIAGLIKKDLLRRRRAPIGVLALIAFPLVFSGMLALSFGGPRAGPPRARLLVEDRDGSVGGGFVTRFLAAEQMRDFLEVVEVGPEGRQMMEDGEASALLVLPEEMTAKLLDGEPVTLELVRNPAQGILPEIAEQVTAILADVMSATASLLREQVEALGVDSVTSIEDLGEIDEEDFARLAVSARRTFKEAGTFLSAPPVTFESVTLGEEREEEEQGGGTVNVFLLILPGVSVYALFLIGDQMMRDVLVESRLGTLARQMSAPVRAGEIIAGKVVVTALVAALVLIVLAAFAAVLAPNPVDLPAFAVLALALVLSITGCAATIYSLVRTERQGGTFAALFYLTLGFTGGSFVPIGSMPRAVQAIAPFNPFYWGTRGFQKLLDDGRLADVAGSVAVLGAIGAALLVLGTVLLRRKVLRGEAR